MHCRYEKKCNAHVCQLKCINLDVCTSNTAHACRRWCTGLHSVFMFFSRLWAEFKKKFFDRCSMWTTILHGTSVHDRWLICWVSGRLCITCHVHANFSFLFSTVGAVASWACNEFFRQWSGVFPAMSWDRIWWWHHHQFEGQEAHNHVTFCLFMQLCPRVGWRDPAGQPLEGGLWQGT